MLFFFSFAIVAVVGIVDKSIAIEFNPKNYGEKETQSQLEINFSVIIQFIFFSVRSFCPLLIIEPSAVSAHENENLTFIDLIWYFVSGNVRIKWSFHFICVTSPFHFAEHHNK